MILSKSNTAFSVGVASLAAPTLCYVFTVSSLLLGFGPMAWMWCVAILSSVVLARWLGSWKSVAIFVVAFVLLSVLSFQLEDSTVDGMWYHQPCIQRIVDGWNPYTTRLNYPKLDLDDALVWNQHYAKAMELMQSVPAAFYGFTEPSKIINLLFLLAAGCLVFDALESAFQSLGRGRRMLITVLLIGNPVCITQVCTFYNDFMLYVGLLIMASALIRILKGADNPILSWSILVSITVVMINVKFTHGLFCALMWLAGLVLSGRKFGTKLFLKVFSAGAVSAIVGIFVFGWNPYVTNTVYYGSPAYPLYPQTIDIMSPYTPHMYADNNRFVNFAISHLTPLNIDNQYLETKAWSMFSTKPSFDWFKTINHDRRQNALGPLYFWMLLAGFALLIVDKASCATWFVFVGIFASAFIFEQAWWTRYVPFVWALPIIPLITGGCKSTISRVLGCAIAGMGVFTICCTLIVACRYAAVAHRNNELVASWGTEACYRTDYKEYVEYYKCRWPEASLISADAELPADAFKCHFFTAFCRSGSGDD